MSEWPSLGNMASSVFNIVDASLNSASVSNIEMVEVSENVLVTDIAQNKVARSSASLDFLLHAAANIGSKSFNIFIQSVESKAIPCHDPRAVQTEIKN